MSEATITSKGQVTIPKSVRDRLSLHAGDRIEFVFSDAGLTVVPIRRELNAMCGIFKGRRAKPASVADMNRAIAEMGSRREDDR